MRLIHFFQRWKYCSYTPIFIGLTKNRTPQEGKEWANLAYDRTFRFGEWRHYVYTFLDIHTLSRGSSGGERRGTGTTSWREEKRWKERKNESVRRGERRVSAALLRGASNFFIPWISDPIRHPRLSAREYKCSPSRLYNHGSVKLTSQPCNQPRNSVRTGERNPSLGHRPLRCVLKFLPNLNPYPCTQYLRSTKLSSDVGIPSCKNTG